MAQMVICLCFKCSQSNFSVISPLSLLLMGAEAVIKFNQVKIFMDKLCLNYSAVFITFLSP